MLHNKQHQPPKGPPPKPKREPRHWNQQIQETVASSVHGESLCIELKGGADSGQFVYLGNVDHDKISYHGEKLYGDDILLEVQGQKVSGYTLRDATVWLKQVSQNGAPVMIKTVRPGEWRFVVWRGRGQEGLVLRLTYYHRARPTITPVVFASRGRGRVGLELCWGLFLSQSQCRPFALVTGRRVTIQARGPSFFSRQRNVTHAHLKRVSQVGCKTGSCWFWKRWLDTTALADDNNVQQYCYTRSI